MKVLIVEDEPIVALDLRFMVEDLGHDVIATCDSVAEGQRVIAQTLPDLAVLDVRLLDGEVFPLADALARRGTALIFHSGHVEIDEIAAAYPGAAFCPKPASSGELCRCIRQMEAIVAG